jgi:tetratricopeptide (TPR) repeat protein
LKLAEDYKDTLSAIAIQAGLGTTNSKKGNDEQALDYYFKALTLAQHWKNPFANKSIASVKNNIALVYMISGNPRKALPYFLNNLAFERKNKNKTNEAIALGNLAYDYALMKMFPKAFAYYDSCLAVSKAENMQEITYQVYKDMSDTYTMQGDYKNAYKYLNDYQELKEKITGKEVQENIATLELQYVETRKQAEINNLESQAKNRQLQNYLLLFILISAAIFTWLYTTRSKKQRELLETKSLLMESDLKNLELVRHQMETQLEHKAKDLTNLALDIARKNDFSEELFQRVSLLEKAPANKLSSILHELRFFIQEHLNISEDFKALQSNVETINHDFYAKLEEHTPGLSSSDKELCGLIRLNLTNKEIGSIKKISDASAKMARYRLKKKLGLAEEDDLALFLKNL